LINSGTQDFKKHLFTQISYLSASAHAIHSFRVAASIRSNSFW
jgi:hypothetical protein